MGAPTTPEHSIALWHYAPDTTSPYRDTAWTAAENIIKVAFGVANIPITPHNGLAAQHFDDKQQPDGLRSNWRAYICHNNPSTEQLVHVNGCIGLRWAGDSGLHKQLAKDVGKLHKEEGKPMPEDIAAYIGRITFPDLTDGQLPGTFWLPKREAADVFPWPRMPDPQEIATSRQGRGLPAQPE